MELQQAINEKVVDMLMERIAVYLEHRLEEKWSTVVNELVNTRNHQGELVVRVSELEAAINRVDTRMRTQEEWMRRNQKDKQHAAKLLAYAMDQLNLGEG